jgi:hypothetical protein
MAAPPARRRTPKIGPTPEDLDAKRADLQAAFAVVEDVSSLLAEVVRGYVTLKDFNALASLLGAIDDLRKVVQWMADETGSGVVRTATDRHTAYPVPGGGLLKIAGGSEKKRYDNDAVRREVITKLIGHLGLAAIVTGDGEEGKPEPVIAALVAKVLDLVGAGTPSFTGWRATVAKELGINLKDFAEYEKSPYKARIEGRST